MSRGLAEHAVLAQADRMKRLRAAIRACAPAVAAVALLKIHLKVACRAIFAPSDTRREETHPDRHPQIGGRRATNDGCPDGSRWSAGCGFPPGRRRSCLHANARRFWRGSH